MDPGIEEGFAERFVDQYLEAKRIYNVREEIDADPLEIWSASEKVKIKRGLTRAIAQIVKQLKSMVQGG